MRLARLDKVASIDALMKSSISDLFPHYYSAEQTASAVEYVGVADQMLIADGTYFVVEADTQLVACGGWSRRDRLYTGSGAAAGDSRRLDPATEPARVRAMFTRADWTRRGLGTRILEACESAAKAEGFRTLALMATLPGFELYAHYGFAAGEHAEVTLPDGVTLACVPMHKTVD